jgi:hypothetical protein
MAARNPEPEIIPPRRADKTGGLDDQSLQTLARMLDDIFVIPGTSIRFGLDPLIGLIPGIGDLITGFASFLIIFSGWQRGLSRVTISRMVANVAIDTLLGSVPVVGDVFDATWKSNRKNLALLQRAEAQPTKKQTLLDALFLGVVILILLLLIATPFALIWLLVRR